MARKTHPGSRIPQRNRTKAQQEVRRAAQADRPQPFGMRRQLVEQDSNDLLEGFAELLLDHDELADVIIARPRLHLTIMRRHQLDAQLARGLVVGYEFGRQQIRLQHELSSTCDDNMDVEVTRPGVMKRGRAIVLLVEGELLRRETGLALKSMAEVGLRGVYRDGGFKPHITLGESSRPLSRIEKRYVTDLVGEIAPTGRIIGLDKLEFYPPIQPE